MLGHWIRILVSGSLIFLIAFAVSFPFNAHAQSPQFDVDVSGLAPFWTVQSILTADREPSAEEWEALFGTPGYRLLQEKERRTEAVRMAMRLAYMPSRQEESRLAQEAGRDWTSAVIPHFIRIYAQRAELGAFEPELSEQGILNEGRARASAFLPPGITSQIAPPPVSLIYFRDGRGYERILLDPLYVMNHPDPTGLIGHELHHHYRNQIAGHAPFGDDLLAWGIANVEVEGIASLVDKGPVPEMTLEQIDARYATQQDRNYFQMYRREYLRSNEWLRRINDQLEAIHENPSRKAEIGPSLHGELPDNGRMVGHFMSDVIIEQLGMPALLQTVGQPDAFWRSYNHAAGMTGGGAFVLSDQALAVIEEVIGSYSR